MRGRLNLYTSSTSNWLTTRTFRGALVQPRRSRVISPSVSTDALTAVAVAARSVPFWVIFATVALATTAVCATVVTRARTHNRIAAIQHQELSSEIQLLRHNNQQLEIEIRRITSDAGSIELAARERLGMVRPNEVVIPIETGKASSTLGSVSFVH